jgi:hypothetical protein
LQHQGFAGTLVHLYDTVVLPDPSEEARFTLATRTYATPQGILMRDGARVSSRAMSVERSGIRSSLVPAGKTPDEVRRTRKKGNSKTDDPA